MDSYSFVLDKLKKWGCPKFSSKSSPIGKKTEKTPNKKTSEKIKESP